MTYTTVRQARTQITQSDERTRLSHALVVLLLLNGLLISCGAFFFVGIFGLGLINEIDRAQRLQQLSLTLAAPPPPIDLPTMIPTLTPTPPPTATPIPTPTLWPTDTPMPWPTPTTWPTDTPWPTNAPAPILPTDTPWPTATAVPPGINGVSLGIIANHGEFEILELRNNGTGDIDVSNWWIDGSNNDENIRCTIPPGIVLWPGATYQIATGQSQPTSWGFKCGDKPIWRNDDETIYLHATDGQMLSIWAARVGP